MDEATQSLQELGGYIRSQLSNDVLKFWTANRELNVEIRPDSITKVLKFLRADANCLFEMLVDICGVDYPDRNAVRSRLQFAIAASQSAGSHQTLRR